MDRAADDVSLFRDLYENAPCGYLSALPDGTIIRVNDTLLTWTGHRRESLLGGTRFQELLPVGDRIYYETHFAPLLTMQGAVQEIAVNLLCADRERLPVLVNCTLSEAAGGDPATIRVGVFRATDRREYERELLLARQRAEESEARARLLARTLQQSLIPPALPDVPGLDLADAYRPTGHGDEVGGDFYDLFETGPGEWGLVLGDVCGKGAQAAIVTSLARHTIRAAAAEVKQPSAVLRRLNAALMREETDRFLTVAYTRIRRNAGGAVRLTTALGGHAPALLVTPAGEVTEFGRPGDLMGVLDQVTVAEESIEPGPGDTLLFFTDGVDEAHDGRAFFGTERLERLLASARGLDAHGVADRVMDDVMTFQNGMPRDDIALVVLKREPAGKGAPEGAASG